MSEKKVVRRSVAIALGIICIILAFGLIGAFTLFNTRSSQDSQTDLQSWTEGSHYFNLTSGQDINFTIPTAGFSSVTITVDALSPGFDGHVFEVFIGFMTANTTVDYQIYDAQSSPQNYNYPLNPWAFSQPWSWIRGYQHWPASFKQTYEVTFSKIMIWMWNQANNTTALTLEPIWGNVYYYLTT
jgi:hypothetical protein